MVARWASFVGGLWLIAAPLVLGYGTALAVLHDVALGLLVCVATLAALEWPAARFALLAPAAWLLGAPRAMAWSEQVVGTNQLTMGVLLAALAVFPSARLERRRAPAGSKMAA